MTNITVGDLRDLLKQYPDDIELFIDWRSLNKVSVSADKEEHTKLKDTYIVNLTTS